MTCKNCGSPIFEDDLFCQKCGQKIEIESKDEELETVSETSETAALDSEKESVAEVIPVDDNASSNEESTPITESEEASDNAGSVNPSFNVMAIVKNSKFLIPAVIGVVLIILIAVCCILFGSASSRSDVSNNVICIQDEENGTINIIYKGKIANKVSDNSRHIMYALGLDCGIIETYDNSLYYFDSKSLKKICSDISNQKGSIISSYGNAVTYIKDDALYLYTISNEKTEKIAADVVTWAVSPNGSAVLYSCRNDDNIYECYIYCKGKSTKIDGKDLSPVAISDNAKYAYYIKYLDLNPNLYVYSQNNSVKLSSSIFEYSYIFNNDLSEIIFRNEKGSFISVDGKESEKVSSKNIDGIVTSIYSNSFYCSGCQIYDVSTLDRHAYYVSDYASTEIRYLKHEKNEWTDDKIAAPDSYSFYTSSNGQSLAFLKKNKLYYIDDISKTDTDAVEIMSDINSFIPSDDLKYFYAIDEDYALQYVDHKQHKKISDDIKNDSYIVNPDGHVFFTSDDVLYTAFKNKPKEKIRGNEGYLELINNTIVFLEYDDSNDLYDVYVNTKGSKLECVLKDFDD